MKAQDRVSGEGEEPEEILTRDYDDVMDALLVSDVNGL